MLNIAVDFDNTYTADKVLWGLFMVSARKAGHNVFIVTARDPRLDHCLMLQELEDDGFKIYWCNGVAKRWCLANHYDLKVDIWIDDKPENILYNSAYTPEEVKEWRATRDY